MISRNNSIEKFFFFFFNIMDELIYEDTDKTIVSGFSGLGGPVIIPEGVTTIAYRALADMTGITSFTLPSTLTTIGEYSFSGNAMTSIVFPASVTNIDNLAFFNNTNLTTVTFLGNNVTPNDTVFYYCSALTTINVPAGWSGRANFNGINVTSVDGVGGDGTGTFIFADALDNTILTGYNGPAGAVVIPDTVTTIANSAFSGYSGYTSFTFLTTLITIGEKAFSGTSISSITLPASVISIGSGAFSGCTNLTSVTFEGTNVSTSANIFYLCSRLSTINVPTGWTGAASFGWTGIASFNDINVSVGGGGGGGVACFVEGTKLLSQNGYKAIDKFTNKDLLVTSDNRIIDFRLYRTKITKTDAKTAPYEIAAHAFGRNKPMAPMYLSPTHKFQLRKNVWISPADAALSNPKVKQTIVGKSVVYYHVECENYLRDNVVAEGMVAESYGTATALKGTRDIYKWNDSLGGYTRKGPSALNKKTNL